MYIVFIKSNNNNIPGVQAILTRRSDDYEDWMESGEFCRPIDRT